MCWQVRIDLGEGADFSVRRTSMGLKVVTLTESLAGIAMVSAGLARSSSEGKVAARYLPEYMGILQLQSPRTEGADRQIETQRGMRLLPYGKREER
jgi:hypothetical protein